jgi:hypothetical protein
MMYASSMDRAEVLAMVEHGRHRKMTPEEREEQRRSFAYGNVAIENPQVTRAMIDEAAERLALRAKSA